MANQTVYPFGTEGTLPSSIGIINDLKTGGADKSLSAEMGKDIGVVLYGEDELCDLSELTAITGIIQSGTFYNSGGTCVLLTASAGKKYRIVAGGNQAEYTVLSSTTLTNNRAPEYATGYSDRVFVPAGTSVEITLPSDAVCIYFRRTYSNNTNCLPTAYIVNEVDGLAREVPRLQEETKDVASVMSMDDAQSYAIAIGSSKKWQTSIGSCILIPIIPGWRYKVVSNENYATHLAVLAQARPGGNNESVSFASGFTDRVIVPGGGEYYSFVAPDGAICLYLRLTDSSDRDMKPDALYTYNFGDRLIKGTFNSSYNETVVFDIRKEFCSRLNTEGDVETFLFFTDPHLTPNSRYESMNEFLRNKYISTLQKYYNSLPLDSCICGGDWLNFSHTKDAARSWIGYCDAYMRKLFRNYIPVFGNHDSNPYNPNTEQSSWLNALTYKEMENLMFRENKGTYYSYKAVNTHFYVLNSGVSFIKEMTNSTYSRLVSNRWPQVDWLGQKFLSEDPEHGIIVLHIYSNGSNESEWFSNETGYWAAGIHALGANVKAMAIAYNKRQSITLNGNTYDFSNCEGNIAFIMCGHTHYDYVDTSGELPIVCCTNLEGGYLDGNTVKYSLEPTFDNCVVDYDSGTLYMVRVGVAKSRIIHFVPQTLSVGSTVELDTELTGTVTWASRDTSKATVSNGTVTGVAAGVVGIKASDDTTEEYWIVKVS